MNSQTEDHATKDQTTADQNSNEIYQQTNNEGVPTMNTMSNNPVLDFVKNLGETLTYLWHASFDWVVNVTWKKFLLVSLLGLIIGGIIGLSALAKFLMFGSLIIKFFAGKEKQNDVVQ